MNCDFSIENKGGKNVKSNDYFFCKNQCYCLNKNFSNKRFSNEEVFENLSIDLIDLNNYCRKIYEIRRESIGKMMDILKNDFIEDAQIKLYGSYATKTSLIWSEVDLLILPNHEKIVNLQHSLSLSPSSQQKNSKSI